MTLFFLLGDQLAPEALVLREADRDRDVVAMAEVEGEIRRYPNHRQRVALFLAAMRHFRDDLRQRGYRVVYQQADDAQAALDLPSFLRRQLNTLAPDRLVLIEPGRHDLAAALRVEAETAGVPMEIRDDPHFLCSREIYQTWADGRKTFVLEHFYRMMRRRTGYLMQDEHRPEGGIWNYDEQNRKTFGANGPGEMPPPRSFPPDDRTKEVLRLVETSFPDLYGAIDMFDWPVTPADARLAVDDFIKHRLPHFGDYQDAMWTGEPYLYHARLAAALNLKLLDPRYVIEQAVAAYTDGRAPLSAVEGFVRQVLGWREFVHGLYGYFMPDYAAFNALDAQADLPHFYWTGHTSMACVREVVTQVLQYGYAHHIQRLMVTGLFALLYGVDPQQVHTWYMAMFVDAVEWVTQPNTFGMSQFADGGLMSTKPYAATGKYIRRMSNYCTGCRHNPEAAVGEDACPFTTLYWDFLANHAVTLGNNRRMVFQLHNLQRKTDEERDALAQQAARTRERIREGQL